MRLRNHKKFCSTSRTLGEKIAQVDSHHWYSSLPKMQCNGMLPKKEDNLVNSTPLPLWAPYMRLRTHKKFCSPPQRLGEKSSQVDSHPWYSQSPKIQRYGILPKKGDNLVNPHPLPLLV